MGGRVVECRQNRPTVRSVILRTFFWWHDCVIGLPTPTQSKSRNEGFSEDSKARNEHFLDISKLWWCGIRYIFQTRFRSWADETEAPQSSLSEGDAECGELEGILQLPAAAVCVVLCL